MQDPYDPVRPEGMLPRFIVVMGVSGVGKTTTARGLAARLGGAFVEADELHPPENVARMAAGRPLDDAARWPWLDAVCQRASSLAGSAAGPVVIACSALKPRYRDVFRRTLGEVVFVHLDGPEAEIRVRMQSRTGHYMPPALLDSQLADLDVPGTETDLIQLSVMRPAEAIVEEAIAAVRRLAPTPASTTVRAGTAEPKTINNKEETS